MKKALFVSTLVALLSMNVNATEQNPGQVSWTFADYSEIKAALLGTSQDTTTIRKSDKDGKKRESGIVYGELGW